MCGDRTWSLGVLMVVNVVAVILWGFLIFSANTCIHFLMPGLFVRGVLNVSDSFFLAMQPIHGIHGLWGAIVLWQLLWAVYSLSGFCRFTRDGAVFANPILMSHAFYVCFIISLVFNVGWLFLWDRLFTSVSLVAILCVTVFLVLALGFSYKSLERHTPILYVQGRKRDIWCVRILIQNGIALYATWAAIQTLLVLGAVLTYTNEQNLHEDTSSTICLGIMAGILIIYALTDYFVFCDYSLFIVTPYAVWIVALAGMFANNTEIVGVNPIFTIVLLATSGVLACTKLYFICLRQVTKASEAEETTEFLRQLDESKHLLR